MTQPPLVIPSDVEVAQAGKSLLANGSALYTLASDDFEVLRVTFVFRAGSAMQRVPFSASAAANMLAEGTRDMTAHQIAERLDYYGSYYDVNIDRDYAYISFCMLSKFFDETLAVAEQILLHPVFPEEELRTYCAKRKQRLAVERTKVDTQAREAFARALFGPSHPYGISADEAQYDKLTRGDVAAFYESHYTADNGFTICSGRIGDHERQAVAALAERLPRREPQAGIPFPAPVTQHEVRVDHPGAVQSSIRIGRLLFPRQHPDFLGMQVVASALGGYFGSRLMQNLREEHGYTYGVVAAMVNFEREGYFAVAAQVGTEVTQDALREIYTEIERLRAEPMPEGELSLVKNIMVGEMMRESRCFSISASSTHCPPFPARHPTARTRTQTAVSDVHDPPRLFPVGRDPVGQLHEIGDRELLGALRKKGMFCAAEIAEHRPQRVADHLAALAE